jgi:hypothetical protein
MTAATVITVKSTITWQLEDVVPRKLRKPKQHCENNVKTDFKTNVQPLSCDIRVDINESIIKMLSVRPRSSSLKLLLGLKWIFYWGKSMKVKSNFVDLLDNGPCTKKLRSA